MIIMFTFKQLCKTTPNGWNGSLFTCYSSIHFHSAPVAPYNTKNSNEASSPVPYTQPNPSTHCTRVKVDSGLSNDQLGGHRGFRVASVEQLGDIQQPAGLVRPVEEAVN